MTKLKRKLNEYLSGEKKAPKGKVKFCPLSPCKRQRTPILQLHKHLQSSTHKLHPGSPSYFRALDKAPRVALKDLGTYINERQERREKITKENSTEDDHTSQEESHENCSRQLTHEQIEENIKGSEALDMMVNDYDEKGRSEETEIEKFEDPCNTDSEEENNSDEEYKALARRVPNQEKRKSESARKLFFDEKLKNRKLTGDGGKKRQKKKTASDGEYDNLAKKVWTAKQHASSSDRYCDSDARSRGEESQMGNTDDGCERDLQNESEVTIVGGTCRNKVNQTIVLSESDQIDDTEYNPKDESDTDESSESSSTETSFLSQERDHFLTELVEVLGKGNC